MAAATSFEFHDRWIKAVPDRLIDSLGGVDAIRNLPVLEWQKTYANRDYIDRLPLKVVTHPLMIGFDGNGRAYLVMRFVNRTYTVPEMDHDVIHVRYNDYDPNTEKNLTWVAGGRFLSRWSPLNADAWNYIDDLLNHRPCRIPDYVGDKWAPPTTAFGESVIELV